MRIGGNARRLIHVMANYLPIQQKRPVISCLGVQEMSWESIEYYRRREFTERAAAKAATSVPARRAHQDLALRYSALARRQARHAGAAAERTVSIMPFPRVF